ncbi:MAG: GTP cyclohydrolase FolE2 [Lysobacteraceae bacterium]|nr:MAG: GTP cyclohydrolase FolE2 [Xanthomonadaceae bacterium]
MPDIANDARPGVAGRLGWVGMDRIEMPVSLAMDDGSISHSVAHVSAYVDLTQPDVRGIHMSRLYLHLDQVLSGDPLTPASLRHLLKLFLESHEGLSSRSRVLIEFDQLVRRPALRSANSGWKRYPVYLLGQLDNKGCHVEMGFELMYSSTCPCSAALARQLIQENFKKRFADGQVTYDQALQFLGNEKDMAATPHSQRSSAQVRAALTPSFSSFPILDAIDAIESALKTPVQTAVKREDEQAFAELNGSNLMFCEDAARRMQAALENDARLADFWIKASHFESLHPHNAVAVVTKGVCGGFGSNDDFPISGLPG